MINDYNPAILLAWEGNMDIQYMGENPVYLIGILLSILPNLKEVMQLLRLVISLQISLLPVSFGILHLEAYLAEK